MKVILIQGRVNAGKTTLCNKIKTYLQTTTKETELLPPNGDDFYHKYVIDNKTIIVVSASDDKNIIKKLKKIFNENQDCDIFITVIRPCDTLKNKELHNLVKDIFKDIAPENINSIDLDTLTKDFIEDKIFNNEFIKTFNNLI